jgi:hypothetical protein
VFEAFLCLVGAMVPVVRAVLTTPYPRWDRWEVERCAQAVGKGGLSDGHFDRELRAEISSWTNTCEKQEPNE